MFLFLLQACNIHTIIFKKPALSADGVFLTLIPDRERGKEQRFFRCLNYMWMDHKTPRESFWSLESHFFINFLSLQIFTLDYFFLL